MAEHKIDLATSDGQVLHFDCAEDEDIVTAAAKAGIHLNAQCRSGSCGACVARRESGDFVLGPHGEDALSPEDEARGQVLLCATRPRGDLKIALPYPYAQIRFEQRVPREAAIVAIHRLTPDTVKLDLQLQADADGSLVLDFEPGQFVELAIPGTEIRRPYSIANPGNWEGRLEFLIKLHEGGQFSTWLAETAAPGAMLTVTGPFGTFTLQDRGLRPRYFVAGGCGLASVLPMVQRMIEWGEPHPIRLFFGVWRDRDVFYQRELADLAARSPTFTYEICVTDASEGWSGRRGSAADAFAQALKDAATEPDVYVCGSPGLVEAVAKAADAHGISRDKLIYERYSAC